jgi:hypothetical protein
MPDERPQQADLPKSERPRRGTVVSLAALASILLLLAAFAVWANRQLLETDTWVETSSELLENEEIQSALSVLLVDVLYENVDVEGEVREALPSDVQGLSGPVSGAIRELATQAAREVLATAPVQALWEEANRTAHETFVTVIEGGGDKVSLQDGAVTLNVGTIVEQLGNRVGFDVAGKIPDDAAQIEIIQSDEISAVQTGADILTTVAWVLVILALGLYVLAIYLAKGWRRVALRTTGWSFIGVGVLVLILRSVTGGVVVGALAANEASEPAIDSVWSIGTSALKAIGVSLITYGVIAVIGTWLAGWTSAATEIRRSLAPLLQERWVAYGILAAIVIVLFLVAPAEGTTRLLPSLILIVLLAAGFEALRRQTLVEFPNASWEETSQRWRERLPGGGDGEAEGSAGEEDRLAGLERLSKLRDSGDLTGEEFEREKRRLLDSE